jgi:hypothetical protein
MASRQDRVASYEASVEQLQQEVKVLSASEGRFTMLRLVSFTLLCLTLAYALFDGGISFWWGLLPGFFFGIVVVLHEKELRRAKKAQKKIDFYESGRRRICGDWHEDGLLGSDFIDKDHLFSGDLNLFGRASLFQKICLCTTAFGRQRLADWLKKPASHDVISSRQEAIKELAADKSLIDSFAELSVEDTAHLEISVLKSWSLEGSKLYNPLAYFFSLFIGMLSVATLIAWIPFQQPAWPFFICLAIDLMIGKMYAGRIEAVTAGISSKEKNLMKLSLVLAVLESGKYESPLMKEITEDIRTQNTTASERIKQIAYLIDSFENTRSNLAVQPFNLLLHINLRNAMKIERWRQIAGASIPQWVEAAANFEALVSLGVFTYENPDYNFPEFVEKGPYLEAKDLGHPLLAATDCVRNDVSLGEPVQLLLISGSNMAGKSTFLRTVGVNVVLAQAGAPVNAPSMSLSSLSLGCSIQIEDSLSEGISHFYAEILRLKKLVDLSQEKEQNVLFFFDEILHGTNSSDRCNGASAVIRSLVEGSAVGFVTTHDLSLTAIADELKEKARNVHFEDQFADGKMTFDYKMKEGVVTHGNALQLMRSLGLDV